VASRGDRSTSETILLRPIQPVCMCGDPVRVAVVHRDVRQHMIRTGCRAGGGELGEVLQPRHHHAQDLSRRNGESFGSGRDVQLATGCGACGSPASGQHLRHPRANYPGAVTIPRNVAVSVEAMIEDLRALVEIDSPSRELDALMVSAHAVATLLESRLGGQADIITSEGGPHVHWSAGGDPRVLILGHHDTVFPLGTVCRRPFRVEDGQATGPGVFDMLGGTWFRLFMGWPRSMIVPGSRSW